MNNHLMKSENTCKLLHLISSHLSSREICKGKEYTLILSEEFNCGYNFDTEVYLFPDTYHRKESNKDAVIKHILQYHMHDICDDDLNINSDMIIPGTYIYKLSIDNKRRKWVQLS